MAVNCIDNPNNYYCRVSNKTRKSTDVNFYGTVWNIDNRPAVINDLELSEEVDTNVSFGVFRRYLSLLEESFTLEDKINAYNEANDTVFLSIGQGTRRPIGFTLSQLYQITFLHKQYELAYAGIKLIEETINTPLGPAPFLSTEGFSINGISLPEKTEPYERITGQIHNINNSTLNIDTTTLSFFNKLYWPIITVGSQEFSSFGGGVSAGNINFLGGSIPIFSNDFRSNISIQASIGVISIFDSSKNEYNWSIASEIEAFENKTKERSELSSLAQQVLAEISL